MVTEKPPDFNEKDTLFFILSKCMAHDAFKTSFIESIGKR